MVTDADAVTVTVAVAVGVTVGVTDGVAEGLAMAYSMDASSPMYRLWSAPMAGLVFTGPPAIRLQLTSPLSPWSATML